MKKLSKIVALLLAGAMAMVMLTACTGGNGPNTPGNPKEQEMMKTESERERMRANILRAVSHDLRTPLTTIYGASTTLLENGENFSPEQQRALLHGIQEDSEWLTRMVEKEIIRREDPRFCCTALVSKEQVRAGQTHTLIDKLYEGSRQMFLASFLKSEKISAAELEEIRRMIEEEEK